MKKHIFRFSRKGRITFIRLPKFIRDRIEKKMRYFISTENPLDFSKKLQGMNDKYRFRIGDYRVIVSKKDENAMVILLILKVAHRGEVYED